MSFPYTVAITPAKMTSERLPRKNLADLHGYPLLYYSIEVAKSVPLINEIYVSSEDREVLNIARSYGSIDVLRPDALSKPEITTKDVLCHAYNEIVNRRGRNPELVVLLQPTHPLRKPHQIEKALKIFNKEIDFDCLFAVMETDELRGQIIKNSFISEVPLPRNKNTEPKLYKNTGSFYIFRPGRSFLTKSFFGEKVYPYILPRSPFEIDIDYSSDLELARCLLSSHYNDFLHFNISPKEKR